MSGKNPYSRHPQHEDTNSQYRLKTNANNGNENVNNRNDNNYHLRNPYSPLRKISQQQQQQPQHYPPRHNSNQGNSMNPQYPFNPYSNKAQQKHTHQPNLYQHQIASTTSNSSFAIKPGEPLDFQNKQHQHSMDSDYSSSSHPVPPQMNRPYQPPQEQVQKDSKIILEKLQEQLDQSNESNFELEASVMALEAELQHTKQSLKEQAESEKSKLEHELRLAQQESKRWKLLAQQQQQKGRSIVRDASTTQTILAPQTTSTFSNRLLGDPTGLRASSPNEKKSSRANADARGNHEDFYIDDRGSNRGNQKTQVEKSPLENTKSQRYFPLSPKDQLGQQHVRVSQLARNLLEQVEPFFEYKGDSKTTTPNSKRSSTEKVVRKDIEMGDEGDDQFKKNDDDTSIRRVLLSIATSGHENLDAALLHHKHPWGELEPPSSFNWNEGNLLEWLVITYSSTSSDRYWSKLLLHSPEARKYVGNNVCYREHFEQQQQQQEQPHIGASSSQEVRRRRRRNRIRPVSLDDETENHAAKLDEWQKQVRKSLHNPYWTPKHNATANGKASTESIATKSFVSTQKASSLKLRGWVTSLSSSWNLRHLHTLRVLLADEGGRTNLDIATSDRDSRAWWSLCYPSIANTVQRIIYRKLFRSKTKRDKTVAKPIVNRPNFHQRNSAAPSNGNRARRYRIGRFQDRLEKLPYVCDEGKAEFGIKNLEEEEDEVLNYALCAWVGLLQVASSDQLDSWYGDRAGIGIKKRATKEQINDSLEQAFHCVPSGALFMVSLVLDLLEELQFDQWEGKDHSTNAMSLSHLLSTGVLRDEKRLKRSKKKGGEVPSKASSKEVQENTNNSGQYANILPPWYNAAIAVLTQVGKTKRGMSILRSRVMDCPGKSDWMGGALDVSIRQLHTLAMHLDDVRTRHGSIVCFEESTVDDGFINRNDGILFGEDPLMVSLLRSVEAWVRLWHQVLLFTQSTDNVSFRMLVLDLQDWFTSTCATLLASQEVRHEIKVMIRWQLDELMMDEEDHEESRRHLGRN